MLAPTTDALCLSFFAHKPPRPTAWIQYKPQSALMNGTFYSYNMDPLSSVPENWTASHGFSPLPPNNIISSPYSSEPMHRPPFPGLSALSDVLNSDLSLIYHSSPNDMYLTAIEMIPSTNHSDLSITGSISTENCPPVICPPQLPLYAPIPLLGRSSSLIPDLESCQSSVPHSRSTSYDGYTYKSGCPISSPVRGSPGSSSDIPYTDDQNLPLTFPTPSELLAELSEKSNHDHVPFDSRPDNARKARLRVVAEDLGFIPTDPSISTCSAMFASLNIGLPSDTITSHEKKRHYLECLEQYVTYLHQQLGLVGAIPHPFERIASYGGLDNRSVRTLLLHMEDVNRKLNLRTLYEEQRFLGLRDAVCIQNAPVGPVRFGDEHDDSNVSF
ncbi:hypothetical protein BDQ12DRAFT_678870 [Crucibulum laeve]|uniref:Uncharacterized protein n=1 Tax=Crucibulum laeve TaxID=68775 RepID=A0A5C3M8A6_9AGAR|nr:hypothetical protein BDQ12DRAFT_678870 [Crucibulum laeve]